MLQPQPRVRRARFLNRSEAVCITKESYKLQGHAFQALSGSLVHVCCTDKTWVVAPSA